MCFLFHSLNALILRNIEAIQHVAGSSEVSEPYFIPSVSAWGLKMDNKEKVVVGNPNLFHMDKVPSCFNFFYDHKCLRSGALTTIKISASRSQSGS